MKTSMKTPKESAINFRISQSGKKKIEKSAKQAGKPVSKYIITTLKEPLFESIFHSILRFLEEPEADGSREYEYLKKCCKTMKTVLPDETMTFDQWATYIRNESNTATP